MWAGLSLYYLVYQGDATVSIHVGRLKVRPSFIIYGDPLKRGAINVISSGKKAKVLFYQLIIEGRALMACHW